MARPKGSKNKPAKKTAKAGKAAKPAKGRGNADSDLLYLGIRNIRAKTWARVQARAKADKTNAGTVLSDAADAYLK